MRTVITGGAGFIGSNLVHELAQRQPEIAITVVDDFSCASFKNLSGYAGDLIAKPCEELDWESQFAGEEITCIYHLASITDTTIADQRLMTSRNVEGFRRVLAFAQARKARLVYASSAATYGQTNGLMKEDQQPAPANVYGFSKMILDNLALAAIAEGSCVVGLRYFNVYGPHEAHKGKMASMVYQLYQQMKTGEAPRVFKHGEQQRDFVYVKDVVAGTILASHCKHPGIYNVGSGKATSFNEIIDHLNGALGTSYQTQYIDNPYEAFYQNQTQADLALAGVNLGYKPRWLPADGIADYVNWLESSNVAD